MVNLNKIALLQTCFFTAAAINLSMCLNGCKPRHNSSSTNKSEVKSAGNENAYAVSSVQLAEINKTISTSAAYLMLIKETNKDAYMAIQSIFDADTARDKTAVLANESKELTGGWTSSRIAAVSKSASAATIVMSGYAGARLGLYSLANAAKAGAANQYWHSIAVRELAALQASTGGAIPGHVSGAAAVAKTQSVSAASNALEAAEKTFNAARAATAFKPLVVSAIGWGVIIGGAVYIGTELTYIKEVYAHTIEFDDQIEKLQNRVNNMDEMFDRLTTIEQKISLHVYLQKLITLIPGSIPSSSFLYSKFHLLSRIIYEDDYDFKKVDDFLKTKQNLPIIENRE